MSDGPYGPSLSDETRKYLGGIWGPDCFVWCVEEAGWHSPDNPCRAGEHLPARPDPQETP